MKPIVLDGIATAQLFHQRSKAIVDQFSKKTNLTPVLATILVGDDPASHTYVKMKHKACEKVGIQPKAIKIEAQSSTQVVLEIIEALNNDPQVFGILLQHPISPHMDERACFDQIAIEKDVDGVTSLGYGLMSMGTKAYGSCTPQGIIHLIKHYDIQLQGLNAVVIGRSPILGKPMGAMLLNENATVTICHSKTKNLGEVIYQADLVVAAVGKKQFIQPHWIKDDCVVIDAGYHPGRVGDVLFDDELLSRIKAYTPVPGGIGPMTIATLIWQTALAIAAKHQIPFNTSSKNE